MNGIDFYIWSFIYRNKHAHDAGISCLQLVKDNENNTWCVNSFQNIYFLRFLHKPIYRELTPKNNFIESSDIFCCNFLYNFFYYC